MNRRLIEAVIVIATVDGIDSLAKKVKRFAGKAFCKVGKHAKKHISLFTKVI